MTTEEYESIVRMLSAFEDKMNGFMLDFSDSLQSISKAMMYIQGEIPEEEIVDEPETETNKTTYV